MPTAPYAPSRFWAAVNGATVVLYWTPPTAATATSYILEAGAQSGGSELANADIGPTLTYTATAVPPGTYYVRVRGRAGAYVGTASNEIVVVVGAAAPPCGCGVGIVPPTGLTYSISGNNVTLAWSYPAGATMPASFVLEAGSFSGAANLANYDTLSTATGYFAPGVGAGTYFVRIRAKNACAVSGGSNEIVVRVP